MERIWAHNNTIALLVNTPIIVNKGGKSREEIAELGEKASFLAKIAVPGRPELQSDAFNLARPPDRRYPPHMQIEVP